MNKLFYCILILICGLVFINCPSTPDEIPPEPTPTPVPTEEPTAAPTATPEPTTAPTAAPEMITEAEVLAVQNAIARAEEVNAEKYAKTDLEQAKTYLDEALKIKVDKPDTARENLALSKKAADAAYEKALNETAAVYSNKIRMQNEKLQEIEADKYMETEYKAIQDEITEIQSLYQSGQVVNAMDLSDDVLEEMTDLYTRLDDKIKWIGILKKDTEKNLASAEKYEAYLWVSDDLEKINEYYFLAMSSMEDYKIENAEEYMGYAKELSLDLAANAKKMKKEKETKDMKNEVLNMLEETSRLNIVTEDGEIIEADPIDIEEFLEAIEKELEEEEGSSPQALLELNPGETLVLGEVIHETLLTQAKEFIKQGIVAEKNGNLDLAMDYYLKARNYLRLHKAQSVSKIYTVRLIPERRDCLWRIAEYDYIYGDPYLWPLIWRRNKKLIQNPNLIQPNWQLIIPEK